MVDEITNPPDEALTLPFLKAANLSPWTVICCESGHPPTDIHNVPGNRDFDKVVRLSRRTYQHPHTTKAQQKEFRQRLMGRYNFGVWNDRTKSYGPYYAETAQLTKRFLQKKAFYILNKSYRPDPNVTELLYQAPNAIRQLFNGLPDPEYDDEVEVLVVVPPPGQAPAPLLPAPPALQAPPQLLAAVAPPAAAPPPAALPPPPPPPAPQAVLPPPPIASRSIVRGIKAFGTILAVLVAFFVFSSILGMGVLFGHEIAVSVGLTNFKSTAPTASTGSATTTGRFFPPRTLVRDASPVDVGPNLDGTMESSAIDFDLAPAVDPIDVRRVDGDLHADPSRNVTGRMRLADDSPGCVEEPPWSDIAVAPGTASDNRLADTPVAPSTVARVDDVIEDTTDCPPIHEHHIPDGGPILGGMDMSSTSGCIFVAPDTCVVDTVVCCECDDIAEMDIKTGVGTDSVSDEDTKDKAITGEANESNDRGSTSSFHFLCIGGVLMVLVVICIVPTLYAEHTSVTGSFDSLTSTTLTMHRESNIRTEHLEEIKIPAKLLRDASNLYSRFFHDEPDDDGNDGDRDGGGVNAGEGDDDDDDDINIYSDGNNQGDWDPAGNRVDGGVSTTIAGTTTTTGAVAATGISDMAATMKTCTDKHDNKVAGTVDGIDYGACIGTSGNTKEDDARDDQEDSKSVDPQREGSTMTGPGHMHRTTEDGTGTAEVELMMVKSPATKINEQHEQAVAFGNVISLVSPGASGGGGAKKKPPSSSPAASKRTPKTGGSKSRYINLVNKIVVEHDHAIAQNKDKNLELDDRIARLEEKKNGPWRNFATRLNQFKNGTKKLGKNLGEKAKKSCKFVRNVFKNGKSEEESHLPME